MLPEAFLRRMQEQLGEAYPLYLQSLTRPRAVALRFNPLKGSAPKMDFVKENIPWEPRGYYYDVTARPGLHPYHEAGVYYLQEASAMAPVALLDPQPGERICDLCAAPGGKSTQIAGRMAGEGLLLCNEYSPKRAKILSQNIERLGIANAVVTNEPVSTLADRFPGFFHRVLVDAPCSGEGMFRKEAAAVTDWSEETVEMCARRQREILRDAAKLVMPGGRLVYSTCTFAPQENEEVITSFLQEHPEFSPEEVDAPWFESVGNGSFRLWPHKLLGEGHFAAVLKRTEEAPGEKISFAAGEKLSAQWQDFAKENGISLPRGKAVLFGQSLYWAPEDMPDIRKLRVLRPGLELGEIKKAYFLPAHALSLWLKKAKNMQNLLANSREVEQYLHGETLSTQAKGWCLVTVDGYSIGWGKGDGNILKNHYPKGLRR